MKHLTKVIVISYIIILKEQLFNATYNAIVFINEYENNNHGTKKIRL